MEASGQEHQVDELSRMPTCKGIEIESGVFSGCKGDADCPVCHGMSVEPDGGEHVYPPWTELAAIAQEAAEMTSEQAARMAYGLQSYGRVEVVLSRSELNKLFAGDVGVIYCEYDQRTEELRICVEGSGLWKNWNEGWRPFNVRGKLLDSSYVMCLPPKEGGL